MKPQKYLAELLGAFTLTLGVSVTLLGESPVPTPVMAGLILGLFVYTVGAISGAHLNPAVTFALATIGKIKTQDAIFYIGAQLVGGLLAWGVVEKFYNTTLSVVPSDTFTVGLAEALGTFFLAFGVCAVVYEKAKAETAGVVIGASLFVGIMVSSVLSNGVLNPAVALGIGSLSVMYVVGPIVGAVLGAWSFRYLAGK